MVIADTGATATLSDGWDTLADGAITTVSPASGQRDTSVTITGERLLGGGEELLSVELGAVSAEIISAADDAVEIVAGISTGSAGVQDITITADTGAVITGVGAFEYLAEGTVSSVSPASGQYGTRVVIEDHGYGVGTIDGFRANAIGANNHSLVTW